MTTAFVVQIYRIISACVVCQIEVWVVHFNTCSPPTDLGHEWQHLSSEKFSEKQVESWSQFRKAILSIVTKALLCPKFWSSSTTIIHLIPKDFTFLRVRRHVITLALLQGPLNHTREIWLICSKPSSGNVINIFEFGWKEKKKTTIWVFYCRSSMYFIRKYLNQAYYLQQNYVRTEEEGQQMRVKRECDKSERLMKSISFYWRFKV